MLRGDPLDHWLMQDNLGRPAPREPGWVKAGLHEVTRILTTTPAGEQPDYQNMGSDLYRAYVAPVVLRPTLLRKVERIGRDVAARGGRASTRVQEALLLLIGYSVDPGSLPFWQEMLTVSRPRDPFARTRRSFAVAAPALMAIRRRDRTAALDALQAALSSDTPDVRAMAASYLQRAWQRAGTAPSEAMLDDLTRLATTDPKFEPSYAARRALAEFGRPAPPENPGGAYVFKVWHRWDPKVYQVIELAADQTLARLHLAIQQAWDWDNDHLYAFYLNGRAGDPTYEFDHPACSVAPAYADQVKLGELGLRPRQRFLYLFDFGDNHLFSIQVLRIRKEAGRGPFPRFVDGQGAPMAQYAMWE